MRGYTPLTKALIKSQLREPVGFFFLIIFAPLLLVIMGMIFGNDPKPEFGNHGFVDNMLPGLTLLSLLTTGIIIAPQGQLMLRSSGALARLRATPLQAKTYVAADLTVNFLLGFTGAVLTLIVGLVAFGAPLPKNIPLLICAYTFGLISMLAIGAFLAAVYPSVAAATGIGNGLMITLIMLSGILIPTAIMPDGIQRVINFSPVYHIAELVRASWTNTNWPVNSILVLAGVTLIFGALGTWLFKWDKTS